MHSTGTLLLVIGLCAAFLAILSLLHVLEPDFDPPHLISEYQLGRFGWLRSVAFFCLGAAALALFGAAKQETDSKLGRFGAWELLIISVAISSPGPSLLIQNGSSAVCYTASVGWLSSLARPSCSRF
jgi:hypothetical protein